MQKKINLIRTLVAAIALATVTAACAPKEPVKKPQTERKLLQEKNATDIYAIPLDESQVEDELQLKKLEQIGEKNEAKKEAKAAEAKAAAKQAAPAPAVKK